MTQANASYKIGELSKATSVPIDTIRYYEKIGVLKPAARRPSSYRVYTEKSVEELNFIRRAQKLGFSLQEIRDLLLLSGNSSGACVHVRDKLRQKVADIDSKLRSMQDLRKAVQRDLDLCESKLHHAKAHGAESCPVLAELSTPVLASN
jgi:DNA-binding transcriptional MerR regulator